MQANQVRCNIFPTSYLCDPVGRQHVVWSEFAEQRPRGLENSHA